MTRKFLMLVASAGALTLSAAAAAAPIVYTGSQQLGSTLATYSITTDGTLGDIDATQHLTAYSVTLTDSISTLTYGRTAAGGTGSASGTFLATATGLTSPLFETLSLYTNATSMAGSIVGVLNLNFNSTYFQNADAAHTTVALATTAEANRTVPFATAAAIAAVPEPATWGMMILGFGVVGAAMRRRVRASEVRFNAKIKRISEGATA